MSARDAAPPRGQESQNGTESYTDQREHLQKQAKQAFDAEMARDKTGDCPGEYTTRGSDICLEKASKVTDANYATFTGAIREILALVDPDSPESGPTGMPPMADESVQEFDALQSTWEQYRKIATDAAYDEYKGGTYAPVFDEEVDQKLIRAHMRELDYIYDGALHR
jgi:hypothetical protein